MEIRLITTLIEVRTNNICIIQCYVHGKYLITLAPVVLYYCNYLASMYSYIVEDTCGCLGIFNRQAFLWTGIEESLWERCRFSCPVFSLVISLSDGSPGLWALVVFPALEALGSQCLS
jgi:hypothetical protein